MKTTKSLWTILGQFLLLGLVSFGGPAAHIGYFQKTFVDKLAWLSNQEYANLVSLSQLLPGPGSSQVGFAIGLHKAGLLGGIAAFIGFTLPSFLLMFLLAVAVNFNQPDWWLAGIIQGLKLLAVVVVFEAILNMYKSFCDNRIAIGIALFSAAILILIPSPLMQVCVICLAAVAGILLKRQNTDMQHKPSQSVSFVVWPLVIFCGLFALSFVPLDLYWLELFGGFFQSGSLVFGGGHVVLPLLQANVAGEMSNEAFLFGYASAQGVPGPMFSIATFLGAVLVPSAPLLGALVATLGIFLPGFLLIYSLHSGWQALLAKPAVSGAAWAINAAVVGLLIATFYQPIWQSAVHSLLDLACVLIGLLCARFLKLHILFLILLFCGLGIVSAVI